MVVFVIYWFSNPHPSNYFDYPFRIAGAFLQGRLGLVQPPPGWLNEFIPWHGEYYCGFPLGSVLTMIPLAILQAFGFISDFPGSIVSAAIAAVAAGVCFLMSRRYKLSQASRLMLALLPVVGTWMWCNLAFASAWQVDLGFGFLGQLLALYFILDNPRPLVAGLCFALAFGNRTELLLGGPILLYLIYRREPNRGRRAMAYFLIAPAILLALTLTYNYLRFSSIMDFGNSHVPGVLNEPWYRYGIWSFHAIPNNMKQMLFERWKTIGHYPYVVPSGFGGSVFLSCPFLFFAFTREARDPVLKRVCWAAAVILMFCLWLHGNTGGWQYSYRYAIELLPWMFVVLLESSPLTVSPLRGGVFGLSVLINAYAVYLFLWTGYITP